MKIKMNSHNKQHLDHLTTHEAVKQIKQLLTAFGCLGCKSAIRISQLWMKLQMKSFCCHIAHPNAPSAPYVSERKSTRQFPKCQTILQSACLFYYLFIYFFTREHKSYKTWDVSEAMFNDWNQSKDEQKWSEEFMCLRVKCSSKSS